MTSSKKTSPPFALLIAFTLSGVAALGHQFLWIRLTAIGLGSETIALMGIVTTFFGGMGFGSLMAPRIIARHGEASAIRWFAAMEFVAALFTLAAPWCLPKASLTLSVALLPILGQTGSAFLSAMLLLSIPCAAVGTTLPLLAAAARFQTGGRNPALLPILYAVNTAGAVIGTLGFVHFILPKAMLDGGAAIAAALSFIAGVLALKHASTENTDNRSRGVWRVPSSRAMKQARRSLIAAMALAGFAGILLEVAATRVLGQVLKGTVYTYANVLAIYLVGIAAGGWLAAQFRRRARNGITRKVNAWLLLALASASVLSGWMMLVVPSIAGDLAFEQRRSFLAQGILEFSAAAVVFFIPTVLMGISTALLLQRAEHFHLVGQAYAANTIGGAVAPAVATALLSSSLSFADYRFVVAIVPVAYVLAASLLLRWKRPPHGKLRLVGAPVLVVIALVLPFAVPELGLVQPREGWKIVSYHEGLHGTVMVSEDQRVPVEARATTRLLQIDRHYFMGGGIGFADGRIGALPVLISPMEPKSALLLGLATGATAGGLVRTAGDQLQNVDAAELVPEVVRFLPQFDASTGGLSNNSRVHVHVADARRFVAATPGKYDLIVGDLFHPHRDGVAFLFTREHFQAVGGHLNQGGVYAQWLPLFQLDPEGLAMVIRSFLAAFPEKENWKVAAWLSGTSGNQQALMLAAMAPGTAGEWRSPSDADTQRARTAPTIYREQGKDPAHLFPNGAKEVAALHWMDRAELVRFAGEGPQNSDRHPRILFEAPRAHAKYNVDLEWMSLAAIIPFHSPNAAPTTTEAIWRDALALYLDGETLRIRAMHGDAHQLRNALEKYIQAFEITAKADIDFQPVVDTLQDAINQSPAVAELALPRMARAAGSAQPQLWKAWLDYLKAKGDRAAFEKVALEAQATLRTTPRD